MFDTNVAASLDGTAHTAPWRILAVIWGFWLVGGLCLALAKPFSSQDDLGPALVLLHMLISVVAISLTARRSVALLLVGSLSVRTALAFWDVYAHDQFPLLHSGADTEMFYGWAVAVANDPSLLDLDIRGGPYSKLFGLIFILTGPIRIFGQYTNVLFGLTAVILFDRILQSLHIERTLALRVLAAAAFLPNSILLSAVFLRESVVLLFLTASLFFLVRWFIHGGVASALASIAMVLVASVFHSGAIVLLIGYAFAFLFYRHDTRRLKFGASTIPALIALTLLAYMITRQYPDLFLGKFSSIEGTQDLVATSNFRRGESAYLTGITVDSLRELILYGPIRALYFLASPLPWDWRGLGDFLAFTFDSLVFIIPIFYFATNVRHLTSRRALAVSLAISVLIVALVFGAGVANAGTAIRHRNKFLMIFLTLTAVLLDRNHVNSPIGETTDRNGNYSMNRISGI